MRLDLARAYSCTRPKKKGPLLGIRIGIFGVPFVYFYVYEKCLLL